MGHTKHVWLVDIHIGDHIAITCRQGLNNEPYMKHLRGTVSVFKAKDVTI